MHFTRRAALSLVVGGIAGGLALAAAAEERVYVLRTQEDGSVVPDCPADDTVKLGALVFAPRTRSRDGLAMEEDVAPPIGTAVGCGRLLTYTPFDTQVRNPFALKLELESGSITARGDCTITSVSFPVPDLLAPLLLLGCTLAVDKDPSAGILNGSATSTSVFTPMALPGYRTGSFWTVLLYVDDLFGRSRGLTHRPRRRRRGPRTWKDGGEDVNASAAPVAAVRRLLARRRRCAGRTCVRLLPSALPAPFAGRGALDPSPRRPRFR